MRASVGAWLAVAAAAARSFDGAIDHAGREQVIHFFRGNSSARYFSIVEAWGGEIVVFAKEAVPGHRGHEHDRVSFWTNCRGVLKDRKDIAGRCFRAPIKHLTDYRSARDANWAHNTASLFEDGVLHMIGGRDGRRRVAHHHVARDGVYRREFRSLRELGAARARARPSRSRRRATASDGPRSRCSRTRRAGGGRTLDHPADGWLVDGATGTVYFFLHRNVPFIREDEQLGDAAFGPRSALTRVPVALATLAAFTERHLPGGCGR
ncbi:ligase [Aureococcus anophagefferens]|nr:ligase [Aureococcus anophagefferens]